jgi:nucleoid DNA-binding protein
MIKIHETNPIIRRTARRAGMSLKKTARIAEYVFESLRDELLESEKKHVHISGLGHFRLQYTYPRKVMRWCVNEKKMVPAVGYWRIMYSGDWNIKRILKEKKLKHQ